MRRGLSFLIALLLVGCTAPPTRETLVAASNMRHPPFSSWDVEGRAVGIEVDIVEAAARELGLRVRWVERPFSELLAAIEAGEVDVAASTIGITEARRRRVAFSKPYYETEIVALVRADASAPRSLAELAGGTIGADEATTAYPAARARWPTATLVGKVRDGMTWPEMVDRGLVDAFVVDASDQERLQSLSGVSLSRIDESLSAELFGIAMALGNDELRAAVNRAIDARGPLSHLDASRGHGTVVGPRVSQKRWNVNHAPLFPLDRAEWRT